MEHGVFHLQQSLVEYDDVHLRPRLVVHGSAGRSSSVSFRGSWQCLHRWCLQLLLRCLLQLSARVLAGVEHCAARRSSSTWSIVVFNCDHDGIRGGVHLGRRSMVDISRRSSSAASPWRRSSSAVSVLPS